MVSFILIFGIFLFSQNERSLLYVKNLLEQRLNSIPNFEIGIGNIEGSIISTVEMKDVEVKVAGEGFIEIEKLSIDYSLPFLFSSILKNRLYLSKTRIEGLNLTLVKDEAGVWNFKKLKNQPENDSGPKEPPITLVFKDSKIQNSQVSIADKQKNKLWEFDLLEESLFSIKIVELTKKLEINAKDVNFDYVSPRIRIRNLNGKIDIASWNCVFKNAGFTVENIPVRGSGVITNLRKPKFDMTVDLDAVKIDGLGELNFRAKTNVKMYSRDNLVGEMDISAINSHLNGTPIRTEFKPAKLNGTKVFLEGFLGGGFGDSHLKGDFDLAKWLGGEEKNKFDFQVELKGADTDELTDIFNRSPYPFKFGNDSTVYSSMKISGSWSNKEIYLLKIKPDYLNVIDGEQSEFQAEGHLTIANDTVDLDLRGEAKRFKLKSEFEDLSFDNYIDGSVYFSGNIPKGEKLLENANLKTSVDISTDRFYEITNVNFILDAALEEEILTVNKVDITADEFSLLAQKREETRKGIDCVFEFASRDLAFISKFKEKVPLSGEIKSTGKIGGTAFAPTIEATSFIEDFSYGQVFLAKELVLQSSVEFDLKNSTFSLLNSKIQAKDNLVLDNSARSLEAKVSGTQTKFDVDATLSKDDGSFISSKFGVEDIFDPEKKVRISFLEGLLSEKRIKNIGDINIFTSPKKIKIKGEQFFYGVGNIANYAGEIDKGSKKLDIQADLTDFNPLIISKILNLRHDLTGSINGKIELAGNLFAPSALIQVKFEDILYGTNRIKELAVDVQGEKGKLFLDIESIANEEGSLSLRGDLRISKNGDTFLETIKGTSINLKLISDSYGFGFAEIFSNSIEKIDGTFSSQNLKLGGTISKPRIHGKLEVENMELFLIQLRNTISTPHARILFNGKKMVLPLTEFLSKNGKAYMEGRMNLSDFTYNADLKMEKIRFNPHSIKTDLSGTLKLDKKDEFLKITGDTEVTAGRIRLYPDRMKTIKDISFISKKENLVGEFSLEKQNGADFYKDKVAMDISVDISSGTWIKTKEANFNTSGKLRLEKIPGADMSLQGNIVSSEGYYTVFGKLFGIEDATLNFTGASQNPDLNIKANYEVDDIDISVMVAGNLREPDLSLSSTPALEEIDIISYIVFGTQSNRLQNRHRAFVGKFATAVAAGGVSELLSSEMGLDLLSIQEGDQGFEDSTFQIGSYLTRDIFVGYERSPSTTSLDQTIQMRNKLNLELRVNKRLSIESQMGGENSGVDFFYNFDF